MRPQILFKLAKDGAHPFCDEGGAILGDGVALLEKDASGRWSPRPQAQLEGLLSLGYGGPVELSSRMGWLRQVAKYLNDGKVGQAGIALLHAQLPPLPSRELARRMAKADRLGKLNPYRVPAGATYARGGEYDRAPGGVGLEYASSKPKETPEERAAREKQRTEDENRRKAARQAKVRAENEAYLKNPRVLAFLDTIGEAEAGAYNRLFTPNGPPFDTFDSFDTHPGMKGDHSPAGKYQIVLKTFDEEKGKMGLSDFKPHTQDLIAVSRLRYRHALNDVLAGNVIVAARTLEDNEWTSFNTKTDPWIRATYEKHLRDRGGDDEGDDRP